MMKTETENETETENTVTVPLGHHGIIHTEVFT